MDNIRFIRYKQRAFSTNRSTILKWLLQISTRFWSRACATEGNFKEIEKTVNYWDKESFLCKEGGCFYLFLRLIMGVGKKNWNPIEGIYKEEKGKQRVGSAFNCNNRIGDINGDCVCLITLILRITIINLIYLCIKVDHIHVLIDDFIHGYQNTTELN